MNVILILLALAFIAKPGFGAEPRSQWVYPGPDGRLEYKTWEQGNRIMDFSFAGYLGGGVKIPTVPVARTVGPSGGDDTAAIQQALDAVSILEPAGGFRGAVLLKPGMFECKSALTIKASGVVLRGSGSGPDGTTIRMTGPAHTCISITGANTSKDAGSSSDITDAYVPSGAMSFQVADAGGLATGDTIAIRRPVTAAWVQFMGMDKLVRNGKKENWVSGEIRCERVIKEISGSKITVDVPLADCLDSKFLSPPASVIKRVSSGAISQAGVEGLRIVAPPQAVEISEPHHKALRTSWVSDVWARDLAIEDTVNSVQVGGGSRRVTVENVRITHTVATKGAAKPMDFSTDGTQVLFNRCSGNGDNIFYFVTGGRVTGPNVVLNCVFHGNGHIQPHMRWAAGLLVDSCQVPESGIDFMNRGEMGSGHGWTMGWAVAWNCAAKSFVIQQPPGVANWAIGCQGRHDSAGMPFGHEPKLPEGLFDSHGTPVTPASLYLAQLRERLGAQALKNIGY